MKQILQWGGAGEMSILIYSSHFFPEKMAQRKLPNIWLILASRRPSIQNPPCRTICQRTICQKMHKSLQLFLTQIPAQIRSQLHVSVNLPFHNHMPTLPFPILEFQAISTNQQQWVNKLSYAGHHHKNKSDLRKSL